MIGLAGALAGASVLAFSLRFHWWRPRKKGVPVLMYHGIGPHRGGSSLNKWRVPADLFSRHLDLLARRGYRGISLNRLFDGSGFQGGRPVVITFDDGLEGVRSLAMPILLSRGFAATVFVVAGKLGGVNDWDAELPGDRLLDAGGVRELQAAGFEIGSHGSTHRSLVGLGEGDLEAETSGSRRRLEEVTGSPVVSFAYPFGARDDRAEAAVRRAGFRRATVIRGDLFSPRGDPFRIPRIPARGTDPVLDLALALTRGRSKF